MCISRPTAQMPLSEPEPRAAAEPQRVNVGEDEPRRQNLTR